MEIDNLVDKRGSIFSGRPALLALALYVAGVLTTALYDPSYIFPAALSVASLLCTTYFYSKGNLKASGPFALALVFFLGWYNTSLSSGSFPPNHIRNLARIGGRVELVGNVFDEPDIRKDRTYLAVDVDSVKIAERWIRSEGKARLRVNGGGSRYNHADRIIASGYLFEPGRPRNPRGFDYQAYLETRNIQAVMAVKSPGDVRIIERGSSFLSSVVSPVRIYLVDKSKAYLDPLSASILSGFILGERRDIPEEYQTMFRNTGTLHLMAVSGSNVGLVLAVFACPLLLFRIPRKVRIAILLAVIIFFALLTRLEPSVVRASIMAAVGLLAYGWIRKPDYVNVMGLAGLLMLIWNPMQVFDVGLQMSFAATFAIIYFIPKPLAYLSRFRLFDFRLLRWLTALSVTTLAAQLAVMPLLARYFNNVPLSGIAANIPVGFLASLSTAGGMIFYFLTILGDQASKIGAIPLKFVLSMVTHLLRFFSSIPYANLNSASPGWPEIFFYWALLYVGFEATGWRRLSRTGLIAALLAFNISIWGGLARKEPSWRVDFIDTGRNRSWIYRGTDDSVVVCLDNYDDRYDPDRVLIPHVMNFFGGRIDRIFSATPAAQPVAELARQFSATVVPFTDRSSSSSANNATHSRARDYIIEGGSRGGANVVWGKSDNKKDDSLAPLLIETADGVMIFGDGGESERISRLVNDRRVMLLELPWGRYAQNSCLRLLETIDPDIAVFSPDRSSVSMPSSRDELTHSEDIVLSTSICGGFSVLEDGGEVIVRTMRQLSDEREKN